MDHSHHEFIKNSLALIGAGWVILILLMLLAILVRLIREPKEPKERKREGCLSTHPGER